MHPFPHAYAVLADASDAGDVMLTADGLPALATAPPVEFDGPGDRWSPESLLVGAVADCYVLTFRAIARASRLEWTHLRCRAEGTLHRVERVTRFTGMRLAVELTLPPGGDDGAARRVIEKAEKGCLITSSLDLRVELDAHVTTADG